MATAFVMGLVALACCGCACTSNAVSTSGNLLFLEEVRNPWVNAEFNGGWQIEARITGGDLTTNVVTYVVDDPSDLAQLGRAYRKLEFFSPVIDPMTPMDVSPWCVQTCVVNDKRMRWRIGISVRNYELVALINEQDEVVAASWSQDMGTVIEAMWGDMCHQLLEAWEEKRRRSQSGGFLMYQGNGEPDNNDASFNGTAK